jgi:hypothetical protein
MIRPCKRRPYPRRPAFRRCGSAKLSARSLARILRASQNQVNESRGEIPDRTVSLSGNPNLRAIVFRQQFSQMTDIVDKTHRLYKAMAPISGFPQTWCTYGGLMGTLNVSIGTPTGNCSTNGVFYPTPLFNPVLMFNPVLISDESRRSEQPERDGAHAVEEAIA